MIHFEIIYFYSFIKIFYLSYLNKMRF